MKKVFFLLLSLIITFGVDAKKIKFDYSLINVPEEGGVKFERITDDADCVYPAITNSRNGWWGKRKLTSVDWWVNPQISLSPDGTKLGYLNYKNNTSNIMVKSAQEGGISVQRTFRSNVLDFTWSPDGKTLCFTEMRNGHCGIYLVDADQGSIVRQISSGTDNDYGGSLTQDNNTVFFHRGEGFSSYSIWSYDRTTNLFSNYSRGMTPVIIPGNSNEVYCARFTNKMESEIWRINYQTGVEEIILAQPGRSFTTPQLSPDGKWLLVTGTSLSEKEGVMNTDIFAIRTDGTQFTQLIYHPGNDLSAIWAPDGRSIFFLSQRGSAKKIFNVWKMSFDL